MRVLVVTNQFFPVVGGIENFVRDFAPMLRDQGHEVAVLTNQHSVAREQRAEHEGVPVFRTGMEQAISAQDRVAIHRNCRWIKSVERDFGPDIVHAHDTGPNLWAHLRIADHAPTVTTVQTSMRGILDPVSIRPACRLLAASDWVTGVSAAVLDEVRELVPRMATRSSVVHNAIPIDLRPPSALPDDPRIVCVGRLVPQKGLDIALTAMTQVVERVPGATLVVAGDGTERDRLHDQARALGIWEQVHFLGVVRHDDIAALLDTAVVVAMPSRFEGLPLACLEAAARARPVVATAVQGLGEVVDDGRTGLVVPVDDPAALASALTRLLTDRDLASALGAARALVTSEFSMPTCIDRYVELYERVREMDRSGGPG